MVTVSYVFPQGSDRSSPGQTALVPFVIGKVAIFFFWLMIP